MHPIKVEQVLLECIELFILVSYRNMKKFHLFRTIFTLVVTLFISLPTFSEQVLNDIVAIVNQGVITRSDLKKSADILTVRYSTLQANMPPRALFEQQVLQKLISDSIQLQLATQLGVTADDMQVEATLTNMAKEADLSLDAYRNHVESQGIDFDDYRQFITSELTIHRVQQREVLQNIKISSIDVEGYLNSPAGQDHSRTEYRLRHILLPLPENPTPELLQQAQNNANDLVSKLKQGDDFQNIAMQKSVGQQALTGGDLGWRLVSQLPTLFVSQVANMQQGEISDPIRSASGFHIIKLEGKRVGSEELATETHTRQILIKPGLNLSHQEAQSLLHKLRQQILQGESFEKLSEKYSHEIKTAAKGGDLGWIAEKDVLPEFFQKMTSLPNGALSEPFQTSMGWHIIQVLERRTPSNSLAAARNQAKDILFERKATEMLEAWLKHQRDEAEITILLPDFELTNTTA